MKQCKKPAGTKKPAGRKKIDRGTSPTSTSGRESHDPAPEVPSTEPRVLGTYTTSAEFSGETTVCWRELA